MTTLDLRNATWDQIRATLRGRRVAAYEAWKLWGPGTTHDVAERSGMSILALRPRTTELMKLGFVDLIESAGGHEGIYAAVNEDIALERFEKARREERGEAAQLPLKLTA